MQVTKDSINHHGTQNAWLLELNTLIGEIENNVHIEPDISIEACKSLLEAIAKNVLKRLDPTHCEKKANDTDVPVLLKKAKDRLLERSQESESDFISRLIPVVQVICEIRNKRGEISHGNHLPKIERSTTQFAKSVIAFTDCFASYLLHLFFTIDLSYSENIKYEDNIQFNEYLDEINLIEGLSYSKALFDQDFVAYEENLATFKADLEKEIEDKAKADAE